MNNVWDVSHYDGVLQRSACALSVHQPRAACRAGQLLSFALCHGSADGSSGSAEDSCEDEPCSKAAEHASPSAMCSLRGHLPPRTEPSMPSMPSDGFQALSHAPRVLGQLPGSGSQQAGSNIARTRRTVPGGAGTRLADSLQPESPQPGARLAACQPGGLGSA